MLIRRRHGESVAWLSRFVFKRTYVEMRADGSRIAALICG